MNEQKELIKKLARIELSRIDFYSFCRTLYPTIYKKERTYLKEICEKLQEFWEDDKKRVLCLSMPPRHGKTYTMNAFVLWLLGRDKNLRISTSSYNSTFATDSTKFLRDTIQEEKLEDEIIYRDIFNNRIEFGTAKKNLFKIEGSRYNFSAISSSPNMTPMGRGLNLEIFDDLYKSSLEALSETYQNKVWSYFANSMLNRLEYVQDEKGNYTKKGKKLVFLNTIWTSEDVIEKVKKFYKEDEIVIIKFKALQEDGSMLCEEIYPREDYERDKKLMDEAIFYAMYQQELIEIKDRLYLNFNSYDRKKEFKEEDIDKTFAVCDPAGTGKDSFSVIIASTLKSEPNKIFIRDIYFSNKLEDDIEEIIATKLTEYKCTHFRIESNGVGQLLPKLIKKELDKLGNDFTIIKSYNQKEHKETKIFANRKNVERYVYYPNDIERINMEFWKELIGMKATSKNEHDDAADSLTELVLMAIKFKYIQLEIPSK